MHKWIMLPVHLCGWSANLFCLGSSQSVAVLCIVIRRMLEIYFNFMFICAIHMRTTHIFRAKARKKSDWVRQGSWKRFWQRHCSWLNSIPGIKAVYDDLKQQTTVFGNSYSPDLGSQVCVKCSCSLAITAQRWQNVFQLVRSFVAPVKLLCIASEYYY